jgi:membrane associated rhomboid family serine protease
MFLPISHDRMVVTRWPWLSLGVIALCTLVFLATRTSTGDRESEERFENAVLYALAHPEAKVDPRLVHPDLLDALRAEYPAATLSADPAGEEAGTQEELDRRTGEWLASLDRSPTWRWGLVPARLRPGALVTHMFLHAGWLHLIGNMLMLYLTGPLLEDRLGSGRFAVLYLVGGILAASLYALQDLGAFRPLVGASGAISAAMGAFAVLLGRVRVKILIWLGLPVGTMVVPAWAIFPFWFAIQLVAGLRADVMVPAGAGGVAYWAHAWGFLAGLGFGFAFRGHGSAAEIVAAPAEPVNDRFAEATRLLARKRWEEAWPLLLGEARGGARRDEAAIALWELAKETGRAIEAAPYFARRVRAEARSGDPLAAFERWRELVAALRGRASDPQLAVEIAEALERAGEGREARAELIESALDGLRPESPPELASRLGRLAAGNRLPAVARALAAARARADLPEATRAKL